MRCKVLVLVALLVAPISLMPVEAQTQVWRWVNGRLFGPGITVTSINVTGAANVDSLCLDSTNKDACLVRDAANTLAQRNGTNAQTFRLYNTYSNGGTDYERVRLTFEGGIARLQTDAGGAGAHNNFEIGTGNSGATLSLKTNNTNRWTFDASSGDLFAISAQGPAITQGSATGVTVNSTGSAREVDYKVTIASTAFVCNATTCDVTVGTLPAKTQITAVFADLTQTFACTATCTSSTLSLLFGRGSGGAQWLASFDADAAAAQFGDADAEMGTTMTRAAAIQGGSFESWSSTQAAVLRLTSGTGNIGNGSVTNLSQGSVTLYITTRVRP